MAEKQLTAVKMGRCEPPMIPMHNCIDYAGLYAEDFMDLYLFSKCEFAITSNSGIYCLAMLFAKPLLVVDLTHFSFGAGAMRYTDKDIFIPKRHFDKQKGRYLTFREKFEIEKTPRFDSEYDEEQGLILYHNTEEEILDATIEILHRIDGSWVDTQEDIENYERYLEIYREMDEYQRSNQQNLLGGAVPWRPAATFLRKNRFMLE